MTHPIVACARGWIGTRFHHQGRVRRMASHGGGVDCLGVLVGVAAELDLRDVHGGRLAAGDETGYSHQPDAQRLRQRLAGMLQEVAIERVAAGDILLLRIDGSPQHLAIVSDDEEGLGMIHAYAPARRVVEHRLDAWWRERIEAVFRLPQ